VDELPDQCREIFILSRYHELTNNEISQKLNIAPSTVKTQIYRALEKIRELLYKKN
jgi:RNA polymerase sigma-70 factor (ECF subfamily)